MTTSFPGFLVFSPPFTSVSTSVLSFLFFSGFPLPFPLLSFLCWHYCYSLFQLTLLIGLFSLFLLLCLIFWYGNIERNADKNYLLGFFYKAPLLFILCWWFITWKYWRQFPEIYKSLQSIQQISNKPTVVWVRKYPIYYFFSFLVNHNSECLKQGCIRALQEISLCKWVYLLRALHTSDSG